MLARAKKALLAGAGAFVTGLVGAAVQKGGISIGWPEVGAALGVGIATAIAVYQAKNADPKPPAGVTGTYVGK